MYSFPVEELATPPLDGIILPGVFRQSILDITRKWVRAAIKGSPCLAQCPRTSFNLCIFLLLDQGEFAVSERYLTMDQLCSALEQQRVKEMFGSGTACTICHLSEIMYKEEVKHTRQHLLPNPHLPYICIKPWKEQQILQRLKEIHNSLCGSIHILN